MGSLSPWGCRIAAAFGCAALCLAGSAGAVPATITVGSLTLTLCNTDYTGYCGAIERAFDPSGVVKGKITVGFEYYPRTDLTRPRLGTILPQEGGPGYSSTGTRDYYLSLFDALRDRRDVLIVDKRGTGLSDSVDCPDLQTGSTNLDAVAACAGQLGNKAWFYGTAYAVNDIVAVMDALDVDVADFYGDSYGTFVGQVLAGLYPDRLRSIILDSAYPVRAPDAWFATDWAAAWSGINLSCARSPGCSSLGGTATSRMQQVVNYLRLHPIKGNAPDGNGDPQPTTLDISALIYLIDSAGYGPPIYRDLDAAARAWLDSKDSLPLLRLVSEVNTASVSDPIDYSYGLAEAVTCTDYPMLYDLTSSRAQRNRQFANALQDARIHRPDLFAPFTLDEGIDSQVYITPLDSCLPWPVPPKSLSPGAPGAPLPPSARFAAVPTLVLSGDLDSITSVIDANETTAQFPNAVHVVVPNLGHVVADGDFIGCTLGIVQRFVKSLSPGNTNCVQKVRPIRTVPKFAARAADLSPLTARSGNQATETQRRIAAAGLEAVGDIIARYYVTYNYVGSGLRGGSFTYAATDVGYDFDLKGVRFTQDVAVSGTVSWNQTNNIITAQVTLKSAGQSVGTLAIRWNDANIDAVASVSGAIQGAALKAERIAP
ncbi:MAG: alpha/beta hydrolase [Gammaproteobacteria bacterium]